MNDLIVLVQENWGVVVAFALFLYQLINIVVGMTKTPEDDKLWGSVKRAIHRAGYTRFKDEADSVKPVGAGVRE